MHQRSSSGTGGFLDDLNPEQRKAVVAVDGPVIVLAGAGSGKTRVLTYRVAHLVASGVRPDSILALTFTNKAAGEMRSRITELVGEESRHVWMGTFHSLFARILRGEAERMGYARNFTIFDTDDSLARVRAIMANLNISSQQYSPQAIRNQISMAKNQHLGPQVLRETGRDAFTAVVAHVYEEYNASLRNMNAMDFDDLLLCPLELFTRHPDVLERYQYRFKYILVDEYQDTNRVQYQLIQALGRRHKNICVVGDDAQSIYSFRGADIRNILDFERDYPDCLEFRLEQNYRSTRTILSAADSLIKQNTRQKSKTLWTTNSQGDPVMVEECEDERDEGRRIVGRIEEEVARQKLSLRDIAILYRTNAQSRSIEDALRRAGFPYMIIGGVAFYRRKEIKDVLAYLRLIANPRDAESFKRAVTTPARGIGETSLAKLEALARTMQVGLLDAATAQESAGALTERATKILREFGGMIRKYATLKDRVSAAELTRALIDEIGILEALKQEGTAEAIARHENIQELVSALTEYCQAHQDATLDQFLEEVSLVSDVDTADFTRNAVTLMTLHAAKGLEFPVVFITGLEEGLFPMGGVREQTEDTEEERRLMYVGITRARSTLYLTYAHTRFRFGESTVNTRSRFVDEIDPKCLTCRAAVRRAVSSPPVARSVSRTVSRKSDDEKYFSDSMPDYERESQEVPQLRLGSRVVHESFGKGRIVAIDGKGERMRVLVDFEQEGRKQLMVKFANLRLQ